MTRYQNGKRAITGIIEYCSQRERIAELRNERWLKLHWQEVQATILEAFYGAEAPLHRFRYPARTGEAVPPKQKTTYQLQALSRPLRKVVRAICSRAVSTHYGCTVEAWWDILECGHRMRRYAGEAKTSHVRYRRCIVCIPKQEAASAPPALARRAHA